MKITPDDIVNREILSSWNDLSVDQRMDALRKWAALDKDGTDRLLDINDSQSRERVIPTARAIERVDRYDLDWYLHGRLDVFKGSADRS